MAEHALSSIKRLNKNVDGSVAPIFGLTLIAMLGCIGLAIDSARAYRTFTHAAASLDIAALSTAKVLHLQAPSDEELSRTARAYFDLNYNQLGNDDAQISNFSIQIDRQKSSVSISTIAQLPTTLGRLFDVQEFRIPIHAAAIYEAKNVELSMMLDVSGSMEGAKIADLQAAAKDLVTIIMAQNAQGADNKIAIAPYSTAVNAGSSAERSTGRAASHTCVTERPGALAYTDNAPDQGPLGRRTTTCPASEVLPLSNNVPSLERHIDDMEADGATAGHLGIAWSWYLVSPRWSDVWPEGSKPKPYDDRDTLKAIIIMTDGEFNTQYERGNGRSESQAQLLCRNIKESGITVFSVAFQAPPSAVTLLRDCATSPQHFFDAGNGGALRSAFQDIARKLTGLRLTL